ncbi:hypothetical protein GCM10009557_06470 [Virgisporangium ochraceum]|uniref:Uncharacterized protein n=1 Tax=Virgisporangium ochraceum TaxID=65505 RepID=A0A8J3ZQZ9_9ACTN|nr:hypothetical protein Voc01_008630 [Virgisporangium ochraceum]
MVRFIRSDHDHRWACPASVVIVNSHSLVLTRGVGPADSTGKSCVRYWPGGSRVSADLRRPENPGETMFTVVVPITPVDLNLC